MWASSSSFPLYTLLTEGFVRSLGWPEWNGELGKTLLKLLKEYTSLFFSPQYICSVHVISTFLYFLVFKIEFCTCFFFVCFFIKMKECKKQKGDCCGGKYHKDIIFVEHFNSFFPISHLFIKSDTLNSLHLMKPETFKPFYICSNKTAILIIYLFNTDKITQTQLFNTKHKDKR